jgi:hypothetical protein
MGHAKSTQKTTGIPSDNKIPYGTDYFGTHDIWCCENMLDTFENRCMAVKVVCRTTSFIQSFPGAQPIKAEYELAVDVHTIGGLYGRPIENALHTTITAATTRILAAQ